MSNGDFTVWGIGTTRTMRVHWMLMELGVNYAFHAIQPRTGETMTDEFLRLNPKHKIPVLQHGSHVLTESAAIITYLSEAFETPAGFYVPNDSLGRSRLNEWCSFIMMELDAVSLYVIRRHGDLSDIYGEAPRAVASAKEYFADSAGAVMKKLPGRFDYLMPDGMSVADILMVTCLDYAGARGIAIPHPLLEYQRRQIQRPGYRRAFERNYPERHLQTDQT